LLLLLMWQAAEHEVQAVVQPLSSKVRQQYRGQLMQDVLLGWGVAFKLHCLLLLFHMLLLLFFHLLLLLHYLLLQLLLLLLHLLLLLLLPFHCELQQLIHIICYLNPIEPNQLLGFQWAQQWTTRFWSMSACSCC
jgi:hypothetical protein